MNTCEFGKTGPDVAAIEPPQRFSFRQGCRAGIGVTRAARWREIPTFVANRAQQIGCAHIIPESFALGTAHQFFEAEGGLKDANVERAVRGVGAALAEMVTKIGTCDRGNLAA